MNKPTIQIDCAPDGSVTIEGKDFTGADCEKATRFLEEGLGITPGNGGGELWVGRAVGDSEHSAAGDALHRQRLLQDGGGLLAV